MTAGWDVFSGPQRRVLVVDDEPAIRTLVGTFLESEGYHVQTAASGAEALDVVRQRPPDVVVLDLIMPGVDGWQFLRTCRATPRLAELAVIVMSATPTLGQSLADLDVWVSLRKPFDLQRLADALAMLFQGLPSCSVCAGEQGTHPVEVFETGPIMAAVPWQLCERCWRFLEDGFDALRPTDDLEAYLNRPGMRITDTELRGFVSAGVSSARRG